MKESLTDLIEERFGVRLDLPEDVDHSPGLLDIARHRSHRHFTAEPVAAPVLDAILACALCAPSKSDLQQLSVIHVADPAKRTALAQLIPSMPWIGTAPVFLLFCGDNRRVRRICELRARDFANDHLDSFFNAAVDGALALMNCIRAAEALGLGCCPVSVVRDHCRRLAELFQLPAHVFPVAGLAIGHPARKGQISPRLSLDATVHVDRYRDEPFAERIDAYDRRRHRRQPIAAQEQRQADRYGSSTFYGWSEDKARQVSVPQREDFGRFILDQGFRLE